MTFLYSWPGGSWQATVKDVIVVFAAYIAILWLAAIFWTYRDIRHRSRDPIVQAASVLVVLLFFVPGIWVYMILRPRHTLNELYERSLEEEALLQELEDQKVCPGCKRRVRDEYLICPSCRTHLKEACAKCDRPLSYSWSACPYCGTLKPAREGLGARPIHVSTAPVPPPLGPRPAAPTLNAPVQQQTTRLPLGRTLRPAPATDDEPVIDSTAD